MKAFKYRLYPTEEQALSLDSKLEMSRRLYNLLLEHSINAYRNSKKGILGYSLQHLALILRGENGFDIYSQSSQDVADVNAAKNIYTLGRRGINACGDDASMMEKAIVSNVAEAGKQGIDNQICQIRSY